MNKSYTCPIIFKSQVVLLSILLLTNAVVLGQTNPPKLSAGNIKQVIKAMTLEEKAHLVVGNDQGFPRGYPSIFGGPDTLFGKVPDVVGNTKQLVQGSAGTTYPVHRLGIPAIVLADGPAGLRIDPKREGSAKTYYATAFPIASLLASTWDTLLVNKVGAAMGKEVLEYGVDILLAPALNIQRNPLGGRNFEYYAEDPLLSGTMAAAMVNGIQTNGVGTSIKHLAANNNETNRMTIDAIIGTKALREIYLKSFEIALQKSTPWTVMSSYNKINGIYANETPQLLTGILRKEWKFKGFVMTDWFAGRNQAKQIAAGNDMIMPGSVQIANDIVKAVRAGTLAEELLDRDVEAILNIIVKTPRFKNYRYSNAPDLKSHAIVATEAAEGGMVLLKNEAETLPFKPQQSKLALYGNGSFRTLSGGTGSGDVNKAYNITIADGLQSVGYQPDGIIKGLYQKYLSFADDTLKKPANFMARKPVISEMIFDDTFIKENAKNADIAIVTITRSSGEFHDRNLIDDYELTAKELMLIKQVSSAFHAAGKRLVILLNVGGVINTTEWKDYADAVLLVWQPGQEGGHAVADLLSGKVNPSGKLPVTFPSAYKDVPSALNFPGEESDPAEVKYAEGEYVGYRYYQAYDVKPAYAFGFGMSYTTFYFSNLKLNSKVYSGKITATVTVKNTGKNPGKEVVQCYIENPSKANGRRFAALKGFAKTELLQPGQTQQVTIKLSDRELEQFDVAASSWILKKGTYLLKIGASSEDTRQTAKFSIPVTKKIMTVEPALLLTEKLDEVR
ncbi:MAG: beta-glucosidase [Sphingobacteriaceae bacterium]|nr:MAG: beta-glucosidase [Sphingobacteriaceae bacterium]